MRAALARELGRKVVIQEELGTTQAAGVLTVSYRRDARELAVTWDDAKQRTISRVIPAREKTAEIAEDSALLASNLTRVEADEFAPAKAEPKPNLNAKVPNAPPAKTLEPAAPKAQEVEETSVATASIFFPLATHYARPWTKTYFNFNLLYGRVGAVDGLELGFVNVISKSQGKGSAKLQGLEVGLAANIVTGEVNGIQAASLFNATGSSLTGLQLAGGFNGVRGHTTGLQLALGMNYAERLTGMQVSLINVGGDVDGVQVGVINVARKVRGVMAGVINVADDIDGVPLAPISITKSGGIHPLVWSGSSGLANAGIKFATRHTYTMVVGNYHRAFDRDFVGGGAFIGGRINMSDTFHADADIGCNWLYAPKETLDTEADDSYHEQLVQPRLRLLVGARLAKHFGPFLGAAAVTQIRSESGWDRVNVKLLPEIFGGLEF
jgi:hypothetical protein